MTKKGRVSTSIQVASHYTEALHKILHGLCYFPQDIASLRPMQFLPTDSFFSINPLLTQMPSTVHLYQNNATNLWNALPERLVTSSFKVNVPLYLWLLH